VTAGTSEFDEQYIAGWLSDSRTARSCAPQQRLQLEVVKIAGQTIYLEVATAAGNGLMHRTELNNRGCFFHLNHPKRCSLLDEERTDSLDIIFYIMAKPELPTPATLHQ